MRANERTDERVAQYLRLYSWLFWRTVHGPVSESTVATADVGQTMSAKDDEDANKKWGKMEEED